ECVILSGILASQGYFSLPGVILACALGGSLGDQIYFYLAWKYGPKILEKFERIRRHYPYAHMLMTRYGALVVLASRFLAGIRIAVSVACGMFKMPRLKYSLLNFASALLWSSLFASLAFRLGRALEGYSKF